MDWELLILIIIYALMFFTLGYSFARKKFNSNERKSIRKHSMAKEFRTCPTCFYFLRSSNKCKSCNGTFSKWVRND